MGNDSKKLTGRVDPGRIAMLEVPRPPQGVVERFMRLSDPSSTVSDVMDEMGLPSGAIGASVLRPTIAGKVVVGPALTMRNAIQGIDALAGAQKHVNRMGEFEAHNLALPGDVLVCEGVADVSNMGGISSRLAQRQGEAGAVIMGGVRDVAYSRSIGFPIWASDYTPVTGKWRIETMEINGPVTMGNARVMPGDLVVADDTGICFIPRAVIMQVLEAAEKQTAFEEERSAQIEAGLPITEFGPRPH
ncbi:dimethylmenaquinone methyltransferase [Devosia sp. Root436]|jgi:regulator of RNase E activity RraA|uniref:RraA family protein n=1 Tax=Devosia sp. Root436 TaxID=1736537 RepID=UPI0006FD4B1A|nr:dimethylmenaquinone methyltransferase [Devosia sp. Root436]KQX38103.1 dimethylmenaquinone methyltransferase [Devosia sp. Root436]